MKTFGLLCLVFVVSQTLGRDCGDGKIRGVNIGGWLVLESWITPSIFFEANIGHPDWIVVDEWTYALYVDKDVARDRLNRHWNEFYQKSDLEKLYNSGISHIRIPVGYWLVDVQDGEPFPPPPATDNDGQRYYLKRMMEWADQIGLKVLIDLHCAPGSQNGFDNSGHQGGIHWLEGDNVDRTLRIVEKLSKLLEDWIIGGAFQAKTLYGIELLNEPGGWDEALWHKLRDYFYPNGYGKVRQFFQNIDPSWAPWVTLQSAFRPVSEFKNYMPEPNFHWVSVDTHNYQCFGEYWNSLADLPNGWDIHLQAACDYHNEVAGLTLATFNGEFSLSITDCGVPNHFASDSACRYYNGQFNTYANEYKDFMRKYFLAQIDAFEYGNTGFGWFFWTAKIEGENSPEWHYLFLMDQGIIPNDLCNRQKHCNF